MKGFIEINRPYWKGAIYVNVRNISYIIESENGVTYIFFIGDNEDTDPLKVMLPAKEVVTLIEEEN